MKKTFSVIMLFPPLLYAGISKAQTSKASQFTLSPPPAAININGDAKEWGDSLQYFNDDLKLNYSIANDKTTLYVAVKFANKLDQMRVLHAGLTLGIDPKGKKKSGYSLTFPLGQPGAQVDFPKRPDNSTEITPEDRENLLRERITTLRNIKVEGFKDIEGDMITTSNTYGIKAAIDYDAEGNLIYEMAIPLEFFHTDISKSEWAFNFKINGIERPKPGSTEGGGQPGGGGFGGGGGGRGGRGGGGMGGGGGRGGRGGRGGGGMGGGGAEGSRSELTKTTDFWAKFYMNKN